MITASIKKLKYIIPAKAKRAENQNGIEKIERKRAKTAITLMVIG